MRHPLKSRRGGRVFETAVRIAAMRFALSAAASALTLICLAATASAQCDDKSQQNAADEAGVRGDLAAASKCAGPGDAARSEKKLEDAAVRAKRNSDEKSGTSENRKENPGSR
jgi:hypothetical protein